MKQRVSYPHVELQAAGLTIVRPSARLRPYVRIFVFFDFATPESGPLRVASLPMGDVLLWLQFGARIESHRFGTLPTAGLTGPQTKTDRHSFPPNVDSLCIEFKPAGARAFLHLPLNQLKNRALPLDELWSPCFVQALRDTGALLPLQRVVQIEKLLLQRLADPWRATPLAQRALALIYEQGGQGSIRSLTEALHISKSQLERTFAAHVGVTPKFFARQHRFANVLTSVHRRPVHSWADFAIEHGYADQSHLIRECTTFTGVTPTQLAKAFPHASFLQDEWRIGL